MPRAKISALIPCYEMAGTVATAVESALAQQDVDVEVVVVDDGSKESPARALAHFDGRVRLIRQENAGVAAARNRAAAEATGEWLAFLDADDRWLPEKSALTLAALEARPSARFAWGQAEGRGADGARRVLGHAPPASRRGLFLSLLGEGNTIPMLTGVVHREAFHSIGGLDESLRTGEDYDLWLRLAERFDAVFVDRPVAIYRMHAGGDVMGDLERWVRSIEALHADIVARYPGDADVAAAALRGNAAVRVSRGYDRLRVGDRAGAREDLEAALACPDWAAEARRLLRHTHLPAPVYRGLRLLLARD